MTEIRPVPGFPGYYAGDDGKLYRQMKGCWDSHSQCRTFRAYVDGRRKGHSVAWYVARAWVDGYDPGISQHVRHVNGDARDDRPANLEWARSVGRADMRAHLESDPSDPRHGTRTGYRYGCKCGRCRVMGPVVHRMSQLRKTLKETGGADDDGRQDG